MLPENARIWITGASTGIGYELVKRFLAAGDFVVATARHIEPLESLQKQYHDQLSCHKLDVTSKPDVQEFCQLMFDSVGTFDKVILNAGGCFYVEWPNFDLDAMHANMDVNFWGLVYCVRYAVPLLQRSKAPHIIGVTSSAGIIGLPRAEGYGSAKAAATYFLQALQAHCYKDKIDVSIVLPGFVDTQLTKRNDFYMPFLMSVDRAADIIYKGIKRRRLEISFPLRGILGLKLLRIMPARLRTRLLSNVVKQK